MKKKIWILLLVLLIIFFLVFFIYKNFIVKNNSEEIIEDYTPEEEISEEQLRETIVTLYFENEDKTTLMPEAKRVDANNLINNPYEYLINLLIDGPKSEQLKKTIPEGTKINSTYLEGDILKIDFSEEFLKAENKENNLNAILKTVTQLNEINGIKILINGEEKEEFKDTIYINKN